MTQSYFTNFNTVSYANNKVVDITERITVTPTTTKNPYAYYPLTLETGVRADTVAYTTYQDPYLSWAVYLTNDIVDPYYEWYLTDDQFNSFIVNKYGSYSNATSKIMMWRNNWAAMDNISADTFASLTTNQYDYWEANTFDAYGTPLTYSRRKQDWTISTNFTVNLTVNANTNAYVNNEIVNFGSNGTAQVVLSGNGFLVVQHLQGTLDLGYVYGTESHANSTISAIKYMSNNIPSDVTTYWSPVYYYNYEIEKNENNKIINVLRTEFMPEFVRTVKKVLSE